MFYAISMPLKLVNRCNTTLSMKQAGSISPLHMTPVSYSCFIAIRFKKFFNIKNNKYKRTQY